MNPLLSHRQSEIEQVELTPEELSLAIWQAKFTKYNRERFSDYWNEQEGKVKAKKDDLSVRKFKD